jgi:hypothetical protein
MSTKTIKQRIAVVAASALTAGFLSVVAMPAAYAADEAVDSQFVLITQASTTGKGIVDSDTGVARSTGWITKTTASAATTGTTALADTSVTAGFMIAAAGGADVVTGVVYSGAQLAFSATTDEGVSADALSIVVSGGKISDFASAAGTTSVNGTGTTAVAVQTTTTDNNYIKGLITVNAAVGSTVNISVYNGTNNITATTATNGVLIGTITLTVASASASGTYSASDSSIYVQPGIAVGGTSSTVQAYDTASALDNGAVGVIWVQTKDAYSSAVTGQLNASSSAGNVVITNSTVAATESYSGTSTFDNEASFDGDGYITVRQPTANTASTSVVTITLDGAVIATKTIKWNGIAASVSLVAASSSSIFKNGYASWTSGTDTTILNVVYSVKDAAGNAISVADAATKLSISDQTGSMVGASLSQTDVSGTAAAADIDAILQTTSLGYGVATMLIPASSLNGAGTYMLKYVNGAGTSLKSAAINATVSSGVASFVASWDKASYQSGDIATLTITAKDSKGNLVADGVALGSGSLVTTNVDGLSSVTSACDSGNIATTTYSAGSKVCKFAVKNAAGSYSYTAKVASSTDQAATAGTVKVTDASGAVSNAEVLKSIVALIASINKQIQALQKLILKR